MWEDTFAASGAHFSYKPFDHQCQPEKENPCSR